MGEGFLKFKRKITFDALIKGLAIGISVGLTAFSVLYLLSKREVINLQLVFCILIGVGFMLCSGGIAYFLFKPSNKRLAKRLDKELAFNEKVQTMIAFRGDNRNMVMLQRNDTEEKLQQTSLSKIKFGAIWKYAVIGVLALAMFVTSMMIPTVEHGIADPPFDLTKWQKVKIENLIDYVEKSGMETDSKTYTVEQLDDLILALDNAVTESVMKTHVIQVIVNVDGKVDEVNSYSSVRAALGNSGDNDLIKLANAVKSLQNSASVQAFDEVSPLFVYATFTDTVSSFNEKVSDVLEDTDYDESDALYASIVNFTTRLKTLLDEYETYTAETLDAALNGENGVGGVFTAVAVEMHDALSQQKVNRRTSDYVIEELMEIFDVSADELPDLGEEELDYKIEEGKEDEDVNSPEYGGIGDGKTDYGSNDQIYDYEEGYVEYGTVLDKYNAQMIEKLINADLPEEVKEFIRDYFKALYGTNGADD